MGDQREDDRLDQVAKAVIEHGNQLGRHLVHFKAFLAGQRKEQQEFLAEQRVASDKAQASANWAAFFSAIAAVAAAIATILLAYDALKTP